MSTAAPMPTGRRLTAYRWQNIAGGAVKHRRGDTLTPRQCRRAVQKALRRQTRSETKA